MNNEIAFFQGLRDGLEQHNHMDKVASIFHIGLVNGCTSVTHEPIMDKIAHLLDETDEEPESTASDRLAAMLGR